MIDFLCDTDDIIFGAIMKPASGRNTRQSQSQVNDSVSGQSFDVNELLENHDFVKSIKNAVQLAVREELKDIKESMRKFTELAERNEAKILNLENENDVNTRKIEKLGKKVWKSKMN